MVIHKTMKNKHKAILEDFIKSQPVMKTVPKCTFLIHCELDENHHWCFASVKKLIATIISEPPSPAHQNQNMKQTVAS